MIKINLISQRRRRPRRRAEKGQESVLIGLIGIIVVGVGVFFLVHRPLEDEVAKQKQENSRLSRSIKKLEKETKNFDKLQAAFDAVKQQKEAIDRLNAARSVPAWMLYELSRIMTKDMQPTMTPTMAKRVVEDRNRAWSDGWDPKHVWITRFEERGGRFRLDGGAQSDADMTQLALRLQASVFFDQVVPEGGGETSDGQISYYRFSITGNVVY